MEYTVDYFINKFEAIPEENWNVFSYVNEKNHNQKCAYGHCGLLIPQTPREENPEAWGLKDFFPPMDMELSRINDGFNEHYQQPTPKQRILAALYDIKAQQNNVDAAKEILTKTQLAHELH